VQAKLNLHATENRSRANGPGVRYVVWFQGCDLGCPGCFNPDTHNSEPKTITAIGALVDDIVHQGDAIEGVTLSGGEPFQQLASMSKLLETIRARTALSVLIFTGYTMTELERMPGADAALANVDVLVAGRYIESKPLGKELRGSSNQRVHLLTDRYTMADIERVPTTEVRIDPSGLVTLTGVDPLDL